MSLYRASNFPCLAQSFDSYTHKKTHPFSDKWIDPMAHLVSAKIDLPLQLQLIIFIYELKIKGGRGFCVCVGYCFKSCFGGGNGGISTRNDTFGLYNYIGERGLVRRSGGTWGFGLKLRL